MDELKDNIVDKITTLQERPVNVQMRQLLYNIVDIHDALVKKVIHPKLAQMDPQHLLHIVQTLKDTIRHVIYYTSIRKLSRGDAIEELKRSLTSSVEVSNKTTHDMILTRLMKKI
jgi:hypothetical protein